MLLRNLLSIAIFLVTGTTCVENVVAGDFSWKDDVSVYVIKTVDLLLLRIFF